MDRTEEITVIVGKYKKTMTLTYKASRIFLKFKYNKKLIAEVRDMEGAKWHGYDEPNPRKIWSIKDSPRNQFQLDFLQGKDPYARYDMDLIEFTPRRDVMMGHQVMMVRHGITRNYCLFACEMGTGKTLSAIELMEWVKEKHGLEDCQAWYVGPRAGVFAVSRELNKWESQVKPDMFTYEKLVREMREWKDDDPAPKVVIFDESSKIKTPTSQRSQAALHLANAVRAEWGDEGYIIEMSGTPAPKTPVDWWHQCEVACPGFLKEGNVNKFKKRMCIIEERESLTGGVYPHIVSWLDDDKKCARCGEYKEHDNHSPTGEHGFIASVNEVEGLYRRMSGLVLVQFKKDCLDLPEKQYQIIRVKPTIEMLRSAKIIKAKASRAIEALNLCRELSDGFQYTENKVGNDTCPNCNGSGESVEPVPSGQIDVHGPNTQIEKSDFEPATVRCELCLGSGKIPKYERATDTVSSPKDEAFVDLLDEHEDVGRFIVWGGFHATIDRLVTMAQQQGWAVLKVDGRGYIATDAHGVPCNKDEFLDAMDLSHPRRKELLEKYPKLCFVGHPDAGGMALTLTASPTELFYSNSFKGEARMQAEDRFHRTGMDANRGATVIDLICLQTDKLVLDNLKLKKKLQDLSMGEIQDAFANTEEVVRR